MTWMRTTDCASSVVEKIWDFEVGIVVFRSMMLVAIPPCVSTPSDSGVTSSSSTFSTSRQDTIQVIDRVRSETEYEPKKNTLCDWCEYKSICPLFNAGAEERALEQLESQKSAKEALRRPTPTVPDQQLSLL